MMIAKLPAEPRPIDWEAIRARLAEAGEMIEHSERFSPEAAAELLARRARALEQPPPREPPADELLVVAFTLGKDRYAIEAEWVREVVRLADFTPLPGAPPSIAGVVNYRGEIIPVVDLRTLFGMASQGLVDMLRVVLVGGPKVEFGALASRVVECISLRPEDLLHLPLELPCQFSGELAKGVTRDALIVLDGRKLLADPRLFVNKATFASV